MSLSSDETRKLRYEILFEFQIQIALIQGQMISLFVMSSQFQRSDVYDIWKASQKWLENTSNGQDRMFSIRFHAKYCLLL